MKEKEEKPILGKDIQQQSSEKIDDRDEITRLLLFKTEEQADHAAIARESFKTEIRSFLNGTEFSVAGLEEEFRLYIAENEKDYEPKFSLFFERLGKLCGWSAEEMARFSKPRIAPVTINEVIYMRFPDGLLDFIHAHNRYVGYYIRRTKNYKLLNEEGIRKLEIYIDDATMLMPECSTYYDFRVKMYEKFNVPYQTELFSEIR